MIWHNIFWMKMCYWVTKIFIADNNNKTLSTDLDHGDCTVTHLVLDGNLIGHIKGRLWMTTKGHVIWHVLADSPWLALVTFLTCGHWDCHHLNL